MKSALVIDSLPGERRVALVEDDLLVELQVERSGSRPIAGNIYLARVRNVLPGMQAAFVDLGLERDAFLHVDDAPGPARLRPEWDEDPSEEIRPRVPPPRIEERVREGEDLLLQVLKDPLGRKGARVTAHLSIPGRLLVLLPGVDHVGVSRRLPEEDRPSLRERLADLARRLAPPGGLILRTAGADASAEALAEEARALAAAWEAIRGRRAAARAPALRFEEAGVVERALREHVRQGIEEIAVDSDEVLSEVRDALARLGDGAPAPRVVRHEGSEPLFDARRLTTQIERALKARVWLPSGGHIAIHPTEALVAIDVNTGKYVGRGDLEETLLRTNLEAVREVARQVRLRDLGGLIVVDFIDMQRPESREAVVRALEEGLGRDRARIRMLPMSEFGLVEMTRQRSRPSLDRQLLRACPACDGAGRVRSLLTLQNEIIRQARRLRAPVRGTVVARLLPEAAEGLRGRAAEIARAVGVPPERLRIETDPALGPDDVIVVEN
ncbi:MAG TPA: Rne/Rng family ribonuclease [Candidatus Polarisedimenticolia bacterium]|nr:Rne/Rng family ribonuclease [Candidatus Polarisedimenticolia bacterium]